MACCRWINVKDFGAKGDGTTDDWNAILSAVDAISSGSVLCFPPGVYLSSGPIYIRGKNHFAVVGYGATIQICPNTPYLRKDLGNYPLAYSPTDRYFSNLEIFNCSDCQVMGLQLDGNYFKRGPASKNQDGTKYQWNHGIHIAGCHRFTVQSVEVQYCQGDGIYLSPMNNTALDPTGNPLFPGTITPESNCSEFALLDIKAHNLARGSIDLGGARNGVIDGLIDYDIGTDEENFCGWCQGVHFEVDPSETGYAVCEWINVTNIHCRNHAIAGGTLFDFSRGARFISVSNFVYEHDQNGPDKPSTDPPNPPGGIWSLVVLGAAVPVSYATDPPTPPWPDYEPQSAHNITLLNGVIRIDQKVIKSLHGENVECWGIQFQDSFAGTFESEPTRDDVKTGWENGQFIFIKKKGPSGPAISGGRGYFLLLTDWTKGTWVPLPADGVDWTSPYHITISGTTIDGPDIGIATSRNTRDILIANNIIQNTGQNSLLLMGQCTVSGNHLLDVTAGSFIRVADPYRKDSGDPLPIHDIISCENNLLRYGLTEPVPDGLAYFWLDSGITRFSANRNQCYGISSLKLFHFKNEGGFDPISFLQNKLYDDNNGFSGEFQCPPASTVVVNNTNVTRFTKVFVIPKDSAAATLMRDHGVCVSTVTERVSFEVSTQDKNSAVGTEQFGYFLS
jgi:hypothetical protein